MDSISVTLMGNFTLDGHVANLGKRYDAMPRAVQNQTNKDSVQNVVNAMNKFDHFVIGYDEKFAKKAI